MIGLMMASIKEMVAAIDPTTIEACKLPPPINLTTDVAVKDFNNMTPLSEAVVVSKSLTQ
jgi:hypothetical protein